MTSRAPRRLVAAAVAGAALLAGCAEGDVVQRQPRGAADGFQATGTLDGSRVAISSGDPNVTLGDCDPGDGRDVDLCLVARTIDGVRVNLVIENPDALVAGESLPVRASSCQAEACDEVSEHAVVDVRVDGEQVRATAGSIRPRETGERWVADVDVRLPHGDRLVGAFDVSTPAASNVPPPQG